MKKTTKNAGMKITAQTTEQEIMAASMPVLRTALFGQIDAIDVVLLTLEQLQAIARSEVQDKKRAEESV